MAIGNGERRTKGSRSRQRWLIALAAVAGVAGSLAAVLLWTIVTRPLILASLVAGNR